VTHGRTLRDGDVQAVVCSGAEARLSLPSSRMADRGRVLPRDLLCSHDDHHHRPSPASRDLTSAIRQSGSHPIRPLFICSVGACDEPFGSKSAVTIRQPSLLAPWQRDREPNPRPSVAWITFNVNRHLLFPNYRQPFSLAAAISSAHRTACR
jgi:hypothetical protein